MEAVFIPHADLTAEGVEKGIPAERLIPTGIPVSARFGEELSMAEARERLGVGEAGRIYLIISGGVGSGNMAKICASLAWRIGKDDRIVVITGRNEKLLSELTEQWRDFPGLTALGYTRDVALWMKAADVTISKAGGLSSTEAAVSGAPLVHMLTIPGCETKNAAFFSERNMSVRAKSVDKAAEAAVGLADNPEEREGMRRAQRENTHRDAAVRVIDYVRMQCG